jgi:hypothetical protein
MSSNYIGKLSTSLTNVQVSLVDVTSFNLVLSMCLMTSTHTTCDLVWCDVSNSVLSTWLMTSTHTMCTNNYISKCVIFVENILVQSTILCSNVLPQRELLLEWVTLIFSQFVDRILLCYSHVIPYLWACVRHAQVIKMYYYIIYVNLFETTKLWSCYVVHHEHTLYAGNDGFDSQDLNSISYFVFSIM